jgi:isopentenyldiphosphate isomerase
MLDTLMDDEYLDLVDDKDYVVGYIKRSEAYHKKIKTFRTINGLIVNQKGLLWIPLRHPNKLLWPSLLDASVGGHVHKGESYDQAFKREVKEELNLDIDTLYWSPIKKFNPFINNVTSFTYLYLILYSEHIYYNKDDFLEGSYVDINTFRRKIANTNYAKPDLLPIIEYVLENSLLDKFLQLELERKVN